LNRLGILVLRSFSGASFRKVIDRSYACVPEHAHEWPVLSLFVIGSYLNETEVGENFISGPSAVFYRAGARHRNTTAAVGFEQIEIEFDPSWLGRRLFPPLPVMLWVGGRVGREARYLAHACQTEASENHLRATLQRFLEGASREPKRAPGEGLQESAARFRVERATRLLRETDQPFSCIALEAGFCDQSHMNRTFRRVLGRSPAAVRQERRDFRQPP
jgi:AraC-like DNA-binding protein